MMRARATVFLATLLMADVALPMWRERRLQELVPVSDLAVVARLVDVVEHTEEGVDYGRGTLVVEEIVFGRTEHKRLTLLWQNPSELACPRIEHRELADLRALWLLTVDKDGVRANHPRRRFPLRGPFLRSAVEEVAGSFDDVRMQALQTVLRREAMAEGRDRAVQQ